MKRPGDLMKKGRNASGQRVVRTFGVILCLLLLLSSLTACASQTATPQTPVVADPGVPEDLLMPEPELKPKPEPKPVLNEAWIQRWEDGRPVFVMLDNHAGARPQAGLKNALMVYEFLAEGNITRYMAVFNGTGGEEIGPVRSARPYFINRALEMDGLYVHVGGSPQAFDDLVRLKVGDIDGLSAGKNIFWRKSHKKIPHNMYTTLNAVRQEAVRRKYKTEVEFEVPNYAALEFTPSGETADSLRLVYRQGTSGYSSGFIYDGALGLYMRHVNGKAHLDELDGSPLSAANVIVQTVRTKTVDNDGRLQLEDIGTGKGWFMTMGIRVPITWEKTDRRAQTSFKLENGTPVQLNPGITWIQVIPQWVEPVWNEGV